MPIVDDTIVHRFTVHVAILCSAIICDGINRAIGINKGTFNLGQSCWLAWHLDMMKVICVGLLLNQWCLAVCLDKKLAASFKLATLKNYYYSYVNLEYGRCRNKIVCVET